MTIKANIAGYPPIDILIINPITETTKIREQGITLVISPTSEPDKYNVQVFKGRLLLMIFTAIDNVF